MTSYHVMKMRDLAQDYNHAMRELKHLTRFGVSREQALARVGLTEDQIEKRETRARA